MDGRINQSAPDVQLAQSRAGAERTRGRTGASISATSRHWWDAFAVHGVFWRKFVDWSVLHLPAWVHPPLLWAATLIFFFVAGGARETVVRHLQFILPRSSRAANYLRALRVFANFGWSLTDAAAHRLRHADFDFELEGETFLRHLASAPNGIVLTAHMGNYNLGAALFAEKFQRSIQMVRAPEPDLLAGQHLDVTLRQSTAGAVKVGYSSDGTSLAFDLLKALRQGEIISIQGDRVVGEVARNSAKFFGREVQFPLGPFALSWVSDTPIYPLFIVRSGYRKYRIIGREPIICRGMIGSRDEQLCRAMNEWSRVLEEMVRQYWPQWSAFTPLF